MEKSAISNDDVYMQEWLKSNIFSTLGPFIKMHFSFELQSTVKLPVYVYGILGGRFDNCGGCNAAAEAILFGGWWTKSPFLVEAAMAAYVEPDSLECCLKINTML